MGLKNMLSRRVCKTNKAVKGVIGRAINDSVNQGQIVRTQDMAVYTIISAVYDDRSLIRRKYSAYKRLRDYRLFALEETALDDPGRRIDLYGGVRNELDFGET